MYTGKELSEREMLSRLLEHEDEILDEQTVEAFRGMDRGFKNIGLSSLQQAWIVRVYKEKDIQRHYNENPMSKDKVPKGRKLPELWWEKPENRPLKPPGM